MRINPEIHLAQTTPNEEKNSVKKINLNGNDPFDLDLRVEARRIQQVVPDPTPYCGSDGNCTGCGCNTCCSSC